MRSLFIIITTFLITASSVFAFQNDKDQLRQLLESRDSQIKTLLGPQGSDFSQEQRNEIKEIINGIIDFRSMAAYALDETYNTISEDNREEFVNLFSTIVRDQSMNRLDIYRADVEYEEITIDGNEALVKTTATLDNTRIPVDYTLKKDEGDWVITDMIIDRVSTAESYNRQFQSIIRQRGFDALLQSLRRRAART
jgi:phospholipid transport system substrate-binding protein